MLHVIRQVQTQKQAFPGTAHNHSTSSACVREVCAGPLLPSPARVSPHDFFLAGCTPELGRKSSPAPATMMYPITCECKTSAQDPTALCPFHLSLSLSIRSFFASCILSVHLCTFPFPFSLSLCLPICPIPFSLSMHLPRDIQQSLENFLQKCMLAMVVFSIVFEVMSLRPKAKYDR